jgi:uncharacterized glyoxalase superfamily protein PhnB
MAHRPNLYNEPGSMFLTSIGLRSYLPRPRAGGKVVRPAARADWGGMSGAFADPDGYVWEVAHNPGWTITDDGSIRI